MFILQIGEQSGVSYVDGCEVQVSEGCVCVKFAHKIGIKYRSKEDIKIAGINFPKLLNCTFKKKGISLEMLRNTRRSFMFCWNWRFSTKKLFVLQFSALRFLLSFKLIKKWIFSLPLLHLPIIVSLSSHSR